MKLIMKTKFKTGQYICIKWKPVESLIPTPLGIMYSPKNEPTYGVWKIEPYKFGGIDYKIHLVPVGESAKIFFPMDRYTSDYSDLPDEMIFDDQSLAEKFVKEFLID